MIVFGRADLERAGMNTLQQFANYLPINRPEFIRWWETGPAHFDLRGTGILQYSHIFERWRSAVVRMGCHNCADRDPPLTFYETPEPFHDGRGRFWYLRWQQPFR